MPISINTNIAAYYSQANIGTSNRNVVSSSARLSSGNRIVQASDDVAALSVGTSLKSNVTTLRQALTNASQGTSLLQVADGALGQVVDLLQRQKALTVNAGSGSLSDTDRSYLDLEFQALANEINRIAASTNFSGINLIDGSLSGAAAVNSNVNTFTPAFTANVVNRSVSGNLVAFANAAAAGDTVTINGFTVTFAAAGTAPGSAGALNRVISGSSAANTAANLAAYLNSSTDARLAGLNFEANGANVLVSYAGGLLSGAYTVNASDTGANITAAAQTLAVANTADGLSQSRVRVSGQVSGTILQKGAGTASDAGAGVVTGVTGVANRNGIYNNADFIGKLGEGRLGKITGSYTGTADQIAFQLDTANGITYTGTAVVSTAANAAGVTVVLTGRDLSGTLAGGTFEFAVAGNATVAVGSINSQVQADPIVSQINSALSTITFTQNRDISSFQNGDVSTAAGVVVGSLQGATVNFNSDDFSDVKIEGFQILAPGVGQTDAVITATINGEEYRSFSGIGAQIATNTAISLQNISNPKRSLTIVTGNTAIPGVAGIALDFTSQTNADANTKLIQDAFGLTGAGAKLSFQVGNRASDTLGVKIASVETFEIFGGATPTVTTLAEASAAGSAVDAALVKVTSARASVGALQSRFNFASSNIQTSLQNQDAARGVLLDTDVAAESTAYATYQVQLQAGISVLAQANQLNQATLQLLQ